MKIDLNKKFRFRNFKVYNDARVFCRDIKDFSINKFPRKEQFILLPQICRALDSIILNIAEGADRGTDKDFSHFLNIAHTSLNEVVACLDVALDSGYITKIENEKYLNDAVLLSDQLTAFRKSLLNNHRK